MVGHVSDLGVRDLIGAFVNVLMPFSHHCINGLHPDRVHENSTSFFKTLEDNRCYCLHGIGLKNVGQICEPPAGEEHKALVSFV